MISSQPSAACFNVQKDSPVLRLPIPAIFLTYDDGPNPEVTVRLLDLLQAAQCAATFFISGTSLNGPESGFILTKMLNEGHSLGNHGLTHDRYKDPQFHKMHEKIFRLCGINTLLVRPPYGKQGLAIRYKQLEPAAKIILWHIIFLTGFPFQ